MLGTMRHPVMSNSGREIHQGADGRPDLARPQAAEPLGQDGRQHGDLLVGHVDRAAAGARLQVHRLRPCGRSGRHRRCECPAGTRSGDTSRLSASSKSRVDCPSIVNRLRPVRSTRRVSAATGGEAPTISPAACCAVGRKLHRRAQAQQLDVLVLAEDPDPAEDRKELLAPVQSRAFEHAAGDAVVRALLFEQVVGFEDVQQLGDPAVLRLGQGPGRAGDEAPQPVAALLDDALTAGLLLAVGDEAFDLLLGVGEEPVGVELEVEPVVEKRPQHGRLVIAVRGVGKAEGRHGLEVDPLLLGVQDLPQLADRDLVDQGLALAGDFLQRIHDPQPAHARGPCRLWSRCSSRLALRLTSRLFSVSSRRRWLRISSNDRAQDAFTIDIFNNIPKFHRPTRITTWGVKVNDDAAPTRARHCGGWAGVLSRWGMVCWADVAVLSVFGCLRCLACFGVSVFEAGIRCSISSTSAHFRHLLCADL